MTPQTQQSKTRIPAAEDMHIQLLRRHIQKWHTKVGSRLGTFNRRAHAEHHRLYGDQLDHVHRSPTLNGDAA